LEQGQTVTIYLSKGPEKKPETVVQSITITVDGNDQEKGPNDKGVHVQIYITDMNNQHKLYVNESITQTKTYNVPLTIPVDGNASYQVYADGALVKEDTIKYSDVYSGGSSGED